VESRTNHPKFATTRKIFESGTVILIFVIAGAVITRPFVQIMAVSLHDDQDALQQTWIVGWVAQQALQDPVHLSEAPNYYPYPHTLAYMDSMVPQSVLALPVILATDNLPLAYNLSVWFALVMNGYAMYLLLRSWPGNFWGVLVGGFIFAFGFYHLIHLGHLNLLSTQWIPFLLLFLHHAIENGTRRDFTLFGFFFLLNALSSFYYAFFTGALVVVYLAIQLLLTRGRLPLKVWAGLAFTAIGASILIVPFGFPYIQVARDFGLSRSANEVIVYSATLTSYLASSTSNPAFSWVHQLFPAPNLESVLSPGLLALVLVLYSLYRGSAGVRTGALVAIAAVGMILSLGLQTQLGQWTIPLPYRFLYDYVPGLGSMRGVARWGVLVLFAAAALAGLEFSDLVKRWGQRRNIASVAMVGVMLIGLCLEYDQAPTPVLPGQPFTQPLAPVYEWLRTQPEAPVAELPIGEPGQFYVPDTWYQYFAVPPQTGCQWSFRFRSTGLRQYISQVGALSFDRSARFPPCLPCAVRDRAFQRDARLGHGEAAPLIVQDTPPSRRCFWR
jgi:hypothetical protein